MVRIGFVGLGRMGMPVAARLAAVGYQVMATDIRAELAESAAAAGLRWCSSAGEVATDAEVVMTMLPGPEECRQAMVGRNGVVEWLSAGADWIDLTSNTPDVGAVIAAAVVERGGRVLEAPVGGGPEAAATGKLTLFVGGDGLLLQHHLPLLTTIASRIEYAGQAGAGYAVKLMINQLWFGQAVATAELMLLAGKLGIDLSVMQRILAGSAASSEFIRGVLPALMGGDYLRTFPVDRVVEELQSVVGMAEALDVPFAVNVAALQAHEQALERYGPADGELLAVALLEERAGSLIRRNAE